jgi:hypothetical protein
MNGRTVVSVFVVVVVVIFAYYIFVLQSEPIFISTIDPNYENIDYLKSENTDTIIYDVVGEIVEVSKEELTLKTSERILTIKKPESINYIEFFTDLPIDETQLQQNDYVRAIINVDKTTDEVVDVSVVVIGRSIDGKLSLLSSISIDKSG